MLDDELFLLELIIFDGLDLLNFIVSDEVIVQLVVVGFVGVVVVVVIVMGKKRKRLYLFEINLLIWKC